jgi:hypothetical protein
MTMTLLQAPIELPGYSVEVWNFLLSDTETPGFFDRRLHYQLHAKIQGYLPSRSAPEDPERATS